MKVETFSNAPNRKSDGDLALHRAWHDGLSDLWFRWIHGKNLVYNTCWEDPRVDREAMNITPQSRIAVITSAGCNTLDYVLAGPEKIYAIDVNPKQNALLDLKLAALKSLDFETFFQIFGRGFHENFSEIYARKLRPLLPPPSQMIWDRLGKYFDVKNPRGSFYFRGSSGFLAWMCNHYLKARGIHKKAVEAFESTSLEEQKQRWEPIAERLWTPLLRSCLDSDVAMSFLGVPRAQKRWVEKTFGGRMSSFVEECLESAFTRLPLRDNYFWWLYLTGSYEKKRCPEYLKEENFERLRDLAPNVVQTRTTTLTRFFQETGKTGEKLSHFVLLDHMDWLADHDPTELSREWDALLSCAAPGAQILLRSGGADVDYLRHTFCTHDGRRAPIASFLNLHDGKAKELHRRDRVCTYGSFFWAEVPRALGLVENGETFRSEPFEKDSVETASTMTGV